MAGRNPAGIWARSDQTEAGFRPDRGRILVGPRSDFGRTAVGIQSVSACLGCAGEEVRVELLGILILLCALCIRRLAARDLDRDGRHSRCR